jgi:N-acetylglutamate synthase-like GNAT family acetyltransferase
MPDILAERDGDGRLLAACGLRGAGDNALFLERYLDRPIEDGIGATGMRDVDRADIVEVGNLAVRTPYTARHLIATLTEYLLAGEAEWSVFTAVPALRNAFARLGVPFLRLGVARIEALPERDRSAWGRYYDKVPEVLAVRVRDAAYALLTRPRQ